MGYRLSWLAGTLGIVLALSRAGRLLRPSIDGLPWQAVMIAAAVLGAAITWAVIAYRLRSRWVVVANVAAAGLTLVRVAVPETTWFVFPTASSLEALGHELGLARDVIRSGVAPVIPLAGIIAILAVVFWALGALLAWGLLSDRPYPAVVAPLVVYLEFAVMDRRPADSWAIAFMLAIGFALLAVALDQRRSGTGLLTSQSTRHTLRRSLPSVGATSMVIVVVMALTAAEAVANLVPRTGYLDWRAGSGLSGQYFGSVSYNPFVGIRQSLVSSSNVPVFAADVDGTDGRGVYWRLVTLDAFDGAQWHVGSDASIVSVDLADGFESRGAAFHGPTERVQSTVTIAALQMDWLPAPYAPVALTSPNSAVERGLRVKADDASLRFDALTYRGMTYTVVSDIPRPDLDVLSLGADGNPSIVFSGAISANEFAQPSPVSPPETRELASRDHYLRLPGDLSPSIGALARTQVAGLQTPFERALALESFFRTPEAFRYSTQITPGHGAEDLAAWLLDPDSPNYRVGYCEQFATAMAVMARTVGIPSRVVLGFTPGTLADDGRIVVRDRNAHAWVELWMPTQGWVRFDPTPRSDEVNPATLTQVPFNVARYLDVPPPQSTGSGPILDGPQFAPDDVFDDVVTPPAGTDGAPTGSGWSFRVPDWRLIGLVAAAALLAALPLAKWRRRRLRLRRLDGGDVAAAWYEIVDRLSDLGDGPPAAATPAEIAGGTTPALLPLATIYSEVTYGPPAALSPERVATAARSLSDTESQLTGRYSLGRRIVARYRLVSIIPPRWRRRAMAIRPNGRRGTH